MDYSSSGWRQSVTQVRKYVSQSVANLAANLADASVGTSLGMNQDQTPHIASNTAINNPVSSPSSTSVPTKKISAIQFFQELAAYMAHASVGTSLGMNKDLAPHVASNTAINNPASSPPLKSVPTKQISAIQFFQELAAYMAHASVGTSLGGTSAGMNKDLAPHVASNTAINDPASRPPMKNLSVQKTVTVQSSREFTVNLAGTSVGMSKDQASQVVPDSGINNPASGPPLKSISIHKTVTVELIKEFAGDMAYASVDTSPGGTSVGMNKYEGNWVSPTLELKAANPSSSSRYAELRDRFTPFIRPEGANNFCLKLLISHAYHSGAPCYSAGAMRDPNKHMFKDNPFNQFNEHSNLGDMRLSLVFQSSMQHRMYSDQIPKGTQLDKSTVSAVHATEPKQSPKETEVGIEFDFSQEDKDTPPCTCLCSKYQQSADPLDTAHKEQERTMFMANSDV